MSIQQNLALLTHFATIVPPRRTPGNEESLGRLLCLCRAGLLPPARIGRSARDPSGQPHISHSLHRIGRYCRPASTAPRLLTTMTLDGSCVCGRDYVRGDPGDEARHAVLHDEYANGKPMPPSVVDLPTAGVVAALNYRLIWSDSSVPQPIRWQAAQVAYLECCELRRPVCYDGSETSERPRLLVALDGPRAVGFVMVAESEVCWRLGWRTDEAEAITRERFPTTNPGIGRVWIAGAYRGRGLGTAMIAHVASRMGVAACDFIWTIPLTPGGKRLVRALCPDAWLADGAWEDLLTTLGEGDEEA